MRVGSLSMVSIIVPVFACNSAQVMESETGKSGDTEIGFLKGSADAQRTVIRPIEDFLSTQGTVCVGEDGQGCADNGEECFLFVPPDTKNFLGWDNDTDTNNDGIADQPRLFASIDYAGLVDGYPAGNTPVSSGTIIERPLSDGRAEVNIRLRTTGANAWVILWDVEGDIDIDEYEQIANRPTIFGHRPRDVNTGAGQALADITLDATVINTAPGAPIPDLIAAIRGCVADVEVISLHFVAHAKGPLTAEFGVVEGTPGTCSINENGIFHTNSSAGGRGVGDGFPAEYIRLNVVGR